MPLYPDDQLTNPQIFVSSPPPLPERPVPEDEYVQAYWCLTQGVDPLGDDSCGNLVFRSAGQSRNLTRFAVKTIEDKLGPSETEETLTDVRLIFPETTTNQSIDGLRTGTVIPVTLSMIASPFYLPYLWSRKNGINGRPNFIDKENLVYFWDIEDLRDDDNVPGQVPPEPKSQVFSSITGGVRVNAIPRDQPTPIRLSLDVVGNEADSDGSEAGVFAKLTEQTNPFDFTNREVNAFTLQIAIEPGTAAGLARDANNQEDNPTQGNQPPWRVAIEFGEVVCLLEENIGGIGVKIGSNDPVFVPLDLNRTLFANQRVSFDLNLFGLTFIPVFNGLLVSDRLPDDAEFGEQAAYVIKDREHNIYTEFAFQVDYHSNIYPPRFGVEEENLFVDTLRMDPTGAGRVDTGEILTVTFERCGGHIKFLPVYFAPELRLYFTLRGERNPGQLNATGECTESTQIFDSGLGDVIGYSAVPIYYLDNEIALALENSEFSVPQMVFVNADNTHAPPWIIGCKFTYTTGENVRHTGIRRPFEVWGFFLYGSQPAVAGFRNADGVLTDEDLPQERFLSCEVTRSLNEGGGGGSGMIGWDLYDPVFGSAELGLLPRPPQRVGGVRVSVAGGQNTIPGVIFTGIGVGNEEEDTPTSNEIHVPLHSREVKLADSSDGLRLLNSPIFDGFDHRDVLQWLCDYGGIPFQTFSTAFRLPTGTLLEPVINFRANTSVWEAIQQIAKYAGTIVFFDRFGVLNQYDVGTTSGTNWTYTAEQILSYGDKPDLLAVHNAIMVIGLVIEGEIDPRNLIAGDRVRTEAAQLRAVLVRPQLDVAFAWDKMSVQVLPAILTPGDFRLAAARTIFAATRARATASVTVPGNANIELLDTFNSIFAITTVAHRAQTDQAKTWTTTLGLELIIGTGEAYNPNLLVPLSLFGETSPGAPGGNFDPSYLNESGG